ncbi:tetratricopeptide repeat protein [Prolixibacteraceae bacterium JC049]|nr:tetratricopeptide repeat protein [Prolixibacteraceae bacterium JC049]
MKRTVLFLALGLATTGVFAQKGKVASAQSYSESGKLEKALTTINLTIDKSNPKSAKSIGWPRTWEVRGNVYRAIFHSKDAKFKALEPDPLIKALDSYKKALELDVKNRFSKSVKIQLTLLNNDLSDQAYIAYQAKDFNKATLYFEKMLELESLPILKEENSTVDTAIIFNAGLAAYNAKNWKKAIKYYTEAAKYGYNGARTYSLIVETYTQMGDTAMQEKTLQEGFLKYPEDNNLLFGMINFYLLTSQDPSKAMEYVDMAIEKDPNNASIHFAKGTLLDKLEMPDEAIKAYVKAVEIKPDYFDAYYNLGAVYYNKGVKFSEETRDIPPSDTEKYDAVMNKANAEFKKAIPYLEKALEVDPNNKETMETLKTLFYRLNLLDKYNEMQDKIKNAE